MEVESKKNNKTIILSVIGVLIILLCGLLAYLYFNASNPKFVFEKAIEGFGNNISNELRFIDSRINKKSELDYNFDFELETSESSLAQFANIINNFNVSGKIQLDYKNKKMYSLTDTKYNNIRVLNPEVYLNESDAFLSIPSLYDKDIKVSNIDMRKIWNAYNYDKYKIIVERMTIILKDNLKGEYFSSGKENGLRVNTLTFKEGELNNYYQNVIASIKNDNKLIGVLCDLTNKETNEIMKLLDDSIVKDANSQELIINIYINNKNDISKIIVKSGENQLILNKNNSLYDISVFQDNKEIKIGSIEISNNKIEAILDYKDIYAKYSISQLNDDANINYEIKSTFVNAAFNLIEKNSVGTINTNVEIPAIKTTFKVNGSYSMKDINEVNNKDFSNAVDMNSISEEELTGIMDKMYSNPGIMAIMTSVQ